MDCRSDHFPYCFANALKYINRIGDDFVFNWWINIVGLAISFIGTLLIFWGSPRDSLITMGSLSTIEKQIYSKEDYIAYKKRGKLSRYGLKLLLLGFALQFLAQISIYP